MGTQIRNTGEGYQLGTSPAQKIGVYGCAPVVQPSGAEQAPIVPQSAANGATGASDLAALKTQTELIGADARAAIVLLNKLRADLAALGWIKGGV